MIIHWHETTTQTPMWFSDKESQWRGEIIIVLHNLYLIFERTVNIAAMKEVFRERIRLSRSLGLFRVSTMEYYM